MFYSAFVLTEAARRTVLSRIRVEFPEVIAHHVTHEFDVSPELAKIPNVRIVTVIGIATDHRSVQAVACEVNGHRLRPDGNPYHITISIDRKAGGKPVHSNIVVGRGFEPIAPFDVEVVPTIVTAGRTSKAA